MAPPGRKNQRELTAKAMDGIIAANGFFSAAVFIGITGTITPLPGVPSHCIPGSNIHRLLFASEVFCFFFYLVSTLDALGVKLFIAYLEATDPVQRRTPETDELTTPLSTTSRNESTEMKGLSTVRRTVIFSVAYSLMGSLFVLMSMIYIIQLKIGLLLSCGGFQEWSMVVALPLLFVGGFGNFGIGVYSSITA